MELKSIWTRTSVPAMVALGIAGMMAAASPVEASARTSGSGVRIQGAFHTGSTFLGISAVHSSTGRDSRYHRRAGNRFYRSGPPKIIKHSPPRRRVVVAPARYPTPVVAASFVYQTRPQPYYRPAPVPIYRVVETHVSTTAPAAGYRVSVATDLLNVRSGPGVNRSIVRTVRSGDILSVSGTAPGWLFVSLPGGGSGWVMERYTAQLITYPAG